MKQLLNTIAIAVCFASAASVFLYSCGKSSTPTPKPTPIKITITPGVYKVVRLQFDTIGSGDTTKLVTEKLTHCDSTGRFTFTATTVKITSSCNAAVSGSYTYDSTTKLVTITGSGTIPIEGLTANSLIWDQSTSSGFRYSLVLVSN